MEGRARWGKEPGTPGRRGEEVFITRYLEPNPESMGGDGERVRETGRASDKASMKKKRLGTAEPLSEASVRGLYKPLNYDEKRWRGRLETGAVCLVIGTVG